LFNDSTNKNNQIIEFNNISRERFIRDISKEITSKFPVLFLHNGDVKFRNNYSGKYVIDIEDSLIPIDNLAYGIRSKDFCLLFVDIMTDGYVIFWKNVNGKFIPNFHLGKSTTLADTIIKKEIDGNLFFEKINSYVSFGNTNEGYHIYMLDTLNNIHLVFDDGKSNYGEDFSGNSFTSNYELLKEKNDIILKKHTIYGKKKNKKDELYILNNNKFVKVK
jgi:hypothetical protein